MENKTSKTLGILSIAILIIIISLNNLSALTIKSVYAMPNEIAPGETAIIEIQIENNADNDIKDVSISLVLIDPTNQVIIPFAPFDSSSEKSFDEIDEGDDETAKFKIIALNNAESGIYKIPLHIEYNENDEIKTKDSLISVNINSKPLLNLNFEEDLLLKGQENEVNLRVINKGLSQIKFLEMEIGGSTYYDILSSNHVYLGDIESDDFDSGEFKIYFKANSPNSIILPVTLTYRDAMNNQYTENFNLNLRVYTTERAIELGLINKNNTGVYITVVIILVIVYLVYRKLRKRKKSKVSEY